MLSLQENPPDQPQGWLTLALLTRGYLIRKLATRKPVPVWGEARVHKELIYSSLRSRDALKPMGLQEPPLPASLRPEIQLFVCVNALEGDYFPAPAHPPE